MPVVAESERGGVLWSASTAREIVTLIAEDAETGLLDPAEAMDLIDRVRARAGSAPHRTVGARAEQGPGEHLAYLPVPKG